MLQETKQKFINTANQILSEKDDINVHLLCTDYAHLTYTMNFVNENVTTCKSIASGGLIITNDNYLVFGKMGKMTFFPDVIQCIGGGLDLRDINKGGEATVNTVIRECEEEIGIRIAKENIIDNKKYVYFREKMSTIGFCYIANLEMNHTELVKIFEAHKVSHKEIEEIYQ